jgi:hypothetical protein
MYFSIMHYLWTQNVRFIPAIRSSSRQIILVLLPRFSEWQYDWMSKVYLNITPYAILLDNPHCTEKGEASTEI